MLQVLDRLPDEFLIMNGDILTDLDYGRVLESHRESHAPITVATYAREVRIDFGVLETNDRSVIGFTEKPTLSYTVSMGVYAISKATLRRYPAGQAFGFDDLMKDLLARGEAPGSFPFEGYWLDIGRPDDYDRANAEFERMRPLLLPGG